MELCLQTKGLCKSYRHSKVLKGVNMHVPKGAIYGFVGKNGAGKTTLIRLICGLQSPTTGTYELYGKQNYSKEIALERRRMGAVVETPSIYMDMTARENIENQYRVLGRPLDGSVDELLRLVGLEDTGKKRAKNFSLGMRQRLGIAMALCGNPDFLVLDEPINGLDPQGIVEVRELILKLNKEHQITVLISSHILDELSRLATHYGFINDGELVKEISAEELEHTCRKTTHVVVNNTKALCRVLDQKGVAFDIQSETEANIFGEITVTDFVTALNEEGCEVISMTTREENLESYFMNLLGGGMDA